MTTMPTNPLIEKIVRAIPKGFFTHLIERQLSLYQQSISMAFVEGWEPAEAFSAVPTIRRCFWESALRKSAISNGLKCFDMDHAAENSSCVLVKADKLILTEHYVEGPNQTVRPAKSRKQNSAVNAWMDEYTDDRLLLTPLPKLGNNPIYLNLLHGANFSHLTPENLAIDPTSCFLRIAIPAAANEEEKESDKYLHNWSVDEILQAYVIHAETAVEDKAHPRRKTKPRKAGAE